MDAKISINDIKLRQEMQGNLIPLQFTRLSNNDIYEQIIYLQQEDLHIPLEQIPDLENRLKIFAQEQFKNRN